MKLGLTNITRVITYLIGLGVIIVCGILLPEIAREEAVGKINPPSSLPYLLGAWILSFPIFISLFQMLKLLKNIDENKAFTMQSVKALQNIKYCASLFSFLIVLGSMAVIIIAKSADPTEDITPIITLGFVLTFVSSVIATFVAVLQKFLKEAILMKTENELAV